MVLFYLCVVFKEHTGLASSKNMVGLTGLEPVTPRLSSACSNQLSYRPINQSGGAEETRTPDILLAKQALYQLSYSPMATSIETDSPMLS